MFLINLHVFWGEGDAWKLLRGVVVMVIVFLSAYSRNLGYENLASANASRKVSLVNLKSLRSS